MLLAPASRGRQWSVSIHVRCFEELPCYSDSVIRGFPNPNPKQLWLFGGGP